MNLLKLFKDVVILLLNIFEKLKANSDINIKDNNDINNYLNGKYEINPYFESIKISAIYGVIGVLWILLSDSLLSKLITDIDLYKKIATYKGWVYVVITMILIFSLVFRRIFLFKKAIEKIAINFKKLNTNHEELVALEEELRQQFEEIETHRNSLIISEERLHLLAYYDMLTELPNRFLFEKKVTELISNNEKSQLKKKFVLINMDIDNFKHINDSLGHSAGDLLLQYISNKLKEQVKAPDFVARSSGDEFTIVFEEIKDRKDVINKIQNLLKHLRKPWVLDKQEFFITFSIGIAIYPEHGQDLSVLLKNSDIAMYFIKKNMKDNYCFYLSEMQEKSLDQIKMVNDLRYAVENNELKLVYQPIINLNNNKLIGLEVLVRWVHPIRGIVPPMEFIPLAEETGLIFDIEKWIVKTALMQKKQWEQLGYPSVKMSINISGKRVASKGFVNEIKALIFETKVNCDEIQLEVTETALMEDLDASMKVLNEIRNMEIKIALDDFGTGYSSLTYLKKLPIDVVKLDREFIRNISKPGEDKVIVEYAINLIQRLKMEIVAEGIETIEQLEFLKNNKCDYGQGYLFSKPISKEEFEKLLLSGKVFE